MHITPEKMSIYVEILGRHSQHKPAHIQHPCHRQNMLLKYYTRTSDLVHVFVGRKYEMEMYVICHE
jgi:hypothetical protein